MTNTATTHFGFKDVPVEDKAKHVRGVFDSVASNYDIMNDAMSAGMHRLWKQTTINALPLRDNMHLLDLAGGTGDISFRFLKRAHKNEMRAKATISDINAAMLAEGEKRALNLNMAHFGDIEWLCADAEKLPLPDNHFDAATMAFGIRNVTNKDKALADIYRVLKPGSPFLCLEFSPVNTPIFKQIYDAYSFNLIPKFGEILAGDSDSYQYLVESIRKFPTAEDFAVRIGKAGFRNVSFERMTGGVVALHKGWKI